MATTSHERSLVITIAAIVVVLVLSIGCEPATEVSLASSKTEVIDVLSRVTNGEPREYMTFDFGRNQDGSGLSVVVPEDRSIDLVFKLRNLIAPGWVVFIGTNRWLGDEDHPGMVELVVASGNDQFDILRLARSDAINYGMMTEDLIKKLETYDKQVGLDIFQASTDTIVAKMERRPVDAGAFAEDVYSFCPDIVDQGVGSLDALRDAIESSQVLYLWWD